MELVYKVIGKSCFIQFVQDLVSAEVDELVEHVEAMLECEVCNQLVLDFCCVQTIDSDGIRQLLQVFNLCHIKVERILSINLGSALHEKLVMSQYARHTPLAPLAMEAMSPQQTRVEAPSVCC